MSERPEKPIQKNASSAEQRSITDAPTPGSHERGKDAEGIESIVARVDDDSANRVFAAWERLRLIYCVILALVVIVFSGAALTNHLFLLRIIKAAIVANVCFCVGPVAEGYLALVGLDRPSARLLLFILGTLLSCLLAIIFVLSSFGID